ncbi:MAG TPA: hypothetical protein ENJ53_09405 [Phaeodactylibacter sp.]|nr:hypothetical protein [Phaeodactylibacter sp.]
MKKNLMIIVLSFLAFQGFSQVETLFNRARVVGAFGGPFVEFSQFKGDYISSTGGGGGLIIDDFFIGGYGVGSVNINDIVTAENHIRMDIGHGGFWLGYTYNSPKLIHLFASTKLGWGGIDLRIDDEGYRSSDNIFVVSPEVGVELNIFRWFKLGGTVGYRAVTGVNNLKNQTNADFSGLTGTLTFRFGGFGDWKRSRRHHNYDED